MSEQFETSPRARTRRRADPPPTVPEVRKRTRPGQGIAPAPEIVQADTQHPMLRSLRNGRLENWDPPAGWRDRMGGDRDAVLTGEVHPCNLVAISLPSSGPGDPRAGFYGHRTDGKLPCYGMQLNGTLRYLGTRENFPDALRLIMDTGREVAHRRSLMKNCARYF